MPDQEIRKQHLYSIQDFLFRYEGIHEQPEDFEDKEIYIQALKMFADQKGLDFISKEFDNPDITIEDTLLRWNPVLTFLVTDALADLEPDRKHKLFSKKISDMTGYEYSQYLAYLKEADNAKH